MPSSFIIIIVIIIIIIIIYLFIYLFIFKQKEITTGKDFVPARLRVVPHFSSGIVERAERERAWKSPHTRKGDTRRGERKPAFSRVGLIFTRTRVSLALLSLRKTGGLLVV